jgi:SulP family sulfate permease
MSSDAEQEKAVIDYDAKPLWQKPFWLLKRNWRAAFTVSLVNIPLSISLAIASGGTPMQGCATAIFSGLMAGAFGGSSYNIYGPAGALTSILNLYAVRYGSGVLPWFALWTSLFVFVMFSLKLERFVLYLPWSVMEGFTLAIAFLIGLNQLNFIFGLELKKKEHFYENLGRTFEHLDETKWEPLVFFVVFFPVLYGLSVKFPKVPWIILLAILGIILGFVLDQTDASGSFHLPTLKHKYGDLKFTIDIPRWGDQGSVGDMIAGSLSVGFICLLETLITAKIADNIADAPEPFNNEMESAACGLANVVVGTMGGLPCTAVLARTKLNIMSGTKGKASQFYNACFCLIICLVALPAFTYLPLSVCACILVLIAARMAPTGTLIHLWHNSKVEFWLMVLVCVVSVGLDPTYGLVLGMVLAFIINADNVAKSHSELRMIDNVEQAKGLPLLSVMQPDLRSACVGATCGKNEGTASQPGNEVCVDMSSSKATGLPTIDASGAIWQDTSMDVPEACPVACYEPRGALTFMNADAIEDQMKRLKNLPAVLVSLDKVFHMDIDGVDRVGKMVQRWRKANMIVVVSNVEGPGKEILSKADWVKGMMEEGLVTANTGSGYQLIIGKRKANGNGTNNHDITEQSPLVDPATHKASEMPSLELNRMC